MSEGVSVQSAKLVTTAAMVFRRYSANLSHRLVLNASRSVEDELNMQPLEAILPRDRTPMVDPNDAVFEILRMHHLHYKTEVGIDPLSIQALALLVHHDRGQYFICCFEHYMVILMF